MTGPSKTWDAEGYDERHSFVWKAGGDLVTLLDPKPGERILDLGCGTGHLAAQMAAAGAEVWGLDSSPSMIDQARRRHPDLRFEIADAADFDLPVTFDAVFSNAALHWMTRPAPVVAGVARALREGGRFVAELGGKGNVSAIRTALAAAVRGGGHPAIDDGTVFYFPSLAEYASLLEAHGLRVTAAAHFDRLTPLEDGEAGLRGWIAMFADRLLAPVPAAERGEVLREVEERLRPSLHRDGTWYADYVRLRVVAVR